MTRGSTRHHHGVGEEHIYKSLKKHFVVSSMVSQRIFKEFTVGTLLQSCEPLERDKL